MAIVRFRQFLKVLIIGAFFALSMAEAVAMPQVLSKSASGMAMMDMPDCANMKMPVPCKDPNALCLGAVCIPMISFWTPSSASPVTQAWTRQAYDGRLLAILEGRSIVPDLEPPIFAG
ncbi:MAG: hypothetical protein AB7H70_09615 [Rhodospirillaceae bacterium]|jgi:hypothetical protein